MVSVSSSSAINHNIRSISLPCRTHPITQRVEEQLKKLKSWEQEQETSSKTNAITISIGLSALQEVYKSIDDLLTLSIVIQSLSNQKKWVDELLDKSIKLLDICGNAMDLVSYCKENARDLHSSLRRSSNTETSITKYLSFSRKLKKLSKISILDLKQTDLDHNHQQILTVIKIIQEVNSKSISIFNSIFKFLSLRSSSSKQITNNRWALVERLVQQKKKGRLLNHYQFESSNELENVDLALNSVCEKGLQIHILHNRLENLDVSLEGLENQLEGMFRCLIQSRTTLLNAFSGL